jgi:uncharacterized protein (TIRG00374 family)
VFAVYLLLINPEAVIAQILKANVLLLLLTLPLEAAFMLLFGLAWFVLLKSMENRASLKDCLSISLVGLFGDIMIPTASVTGEAIRLALTKKKIGIGLNKALASILVHRTLNFVALTPFLLIGLISSRLDKSNGVGPLILLVLALMAVGIGLPLLRHLSKSKTFQGYMFRASQKLLTTFRKWNDERGAIVEHNINEFCQALDRMFSRPQTLALSFIMSLGQWGAAMTIPYVTFLALSYEVPYSLILVAYPVYSLSYMIPVGIPAMLGVVESAMTATFAALGVAPAMASSASVLIRVVTVWFEVAVTGSVAAFYSADIFRGLFGFSRVSRSPMHGYEPEVVSRPYSEVREVLKPLKHFVQDHERRK